MKTLFTLIGMIIGFATYLLGQEYYTRRFGVTMPNKGIYRLMQITIPAVAAGLFCIYGYSLWNITQLVILTSLILLAAKIDKHHKVIPNDLIGILVIVKLMIFGCQFFVDKVELASDFSNGVCGLVTITITFVILRFMYKQSIGMGDIKLMMVIGLYLEMMRSMYVLLLSSIVAVTVCLLAMAKKRMTRKDSMSFGPSIAFGSIAIMILGI